MNSPPLPRVLLVEDDPVSQAFLEAAVGAVPACVDATASVAGALELARTRDYALWLFDAHLPDGTGDALLRTLRAEGLATPAIAHTAGNDRRLTEGLMAAGFLEVLCKPLPASAVQAAVRAVLGDASAVRGDLRTPDAASTLLWDTDAAARALGGNTAHVAALRALFLQELDGMASRIPVLAATGNPAALRSELHRLSASCGFVGATRLGLATRRLQEAPGDHTVLEAFLIALQLTRRSSPH